MERMTLQQRRLLLLLAPTLIVRKHGNCVRGDPEIIVAVLDEGVMYTHEDLTANMWVRKGTGWF